MNFIYNKTKNIKSIDVIYSLESYSHKKEYTNPLRQRES